MSKETYRKNAGIILVNKEGLILACERSDVPGAWQMPQGGIDKGETPAAAALRECIEETGVKEDDIELVAESVEWHFYKFPKKHKDDAFFGQQQKWFLFKYMGEYDVDVTTAKYTEFTAHKWVTPKWMYNNVVDFRKSIYKIIFEEFSAYLAD